MNKHHDYAEAAAGAVANTNHEGFNEELRADALIHATLSLAYEQRTANLIALEMLLAGQGAEIDVEGITNRMGL